MGKSVIRGRETVQTAVNLDLLEFAVQKVVLSVKRFSYSL